MVTKQEASRLRDKMRIGVPVWHGKDFATTIVDIDKDIRKAAESPPLGCDGISVCVNPSFVPAIIAILHQQGFDAKINHLDNFRIDISW